MPAPTSVRALRHRLLLAAGILLLIAGCGAAQTPVAAGDGVGPIPAGDARVWFYRVFFPDDTGGMPAVMINGATVGYARAGWKFYRDVPAGAYQLSVASFSTDYDQTRNVVLQPGAELAFSIQSSPTLNSNLGTGWRGATYSVWVEPPQIAAQHFAQTQLGSGY